nr:MAG TPA: hypothetical protein [Caudoviricetes sp.]DAW07731.1 MAG TPA: hypothetical protein [Bacteriophage sp.]
MQVVQILENRQRYFEVQACKCLSLQIVLFY